jgi:hypothetical protein
MLATLAPASFAGEETPEHTLHLFEVERFRQDRVSFHLVSIV